MFRNKFVLLGLGATVLNAATTVNRMLRRIDFEDKVVVITGGSRGLGLVLARKLALDEFRVFGKEEDAALQLDLSGALLDLAVLDRGGHNSDFK